MATAGVETVWTRVEVENLRREFVAELDRQLEAISAYHETAAPWWSVPEEGVFLLHLRFRGMVVPVNGEATTALLRSLEDVRGVLMGVRQAALLGLLDPQLLTCAPPREG